MLPWMMTIDDFPSNGYSDLYIRPKVGEAVLCVKSSEAFQTADLRI
jgi:hypothetical protein